MASGDSVVQIIKAMPPASNPATIDYRAGGSTPNEQVLVHDFDGSTVEYMDFLCKLEGYSGGGLTFTLPWSATSVTSGTATWGIGIRRMEDDAEDIDASHSYQYNDGDDTAPSVSGELSYPTIAFTDGSDMDSWAEGELAIVRVRRNTAGSDDIATDIELWAIFGLET